MNWLHRINYMKSAKAWITVSVILSVISVIAMFTRGFNQGIDFTGGSLFDVKFQQKVTSAQVETAAKVAGDVKVQQAQVKGEAAAATSEFFVRTPELTKEKRTALMAELEKVGKYELISEDAVSATVSGELTQKALLAVAIAALLQIVYLWFRFQFKFGVTAVVALLHDIVITLGFVALFQVPISSAFVAAILTILGYSINDTVIVFDRIRENLARRKKGEDLEPLTTRSIQEVITRSIYTVLTVELSILPLLIWGGESIYDFALTLFVGIGSGMYSSIFIAAALWLFWEKKDRANHRAAAANKPAKA